MLLEVRIPLPFGVEEFFSGTFFTYSKESYDCISSGVRCLLSEPFEAEGGKHGLFTKRQFNYGSFFPSLLVKLMPKLKEVWFTEECRYVYPDVRTDTFSELLGDKFKLTSRSTMVPNDDGAQTNVFNMDKESLGVRQVIVIDIFNTPNPLVDSAKSQLTIPARFEFIKEKEWWKRTKPLSCSYTLLDISISGMMQNKIEKLLTKDMVDRMQLSKLRSICWIDQWEKLPLADALQLDREFEATAHTQQGFPAPSRIPVAEVAARLLGQAPPTAVGPTPSVATTAASAHQPEPTTPTQTKRPSRKNNPLFQERVQIRQKVKEWYHHFVSKHNREPTNHECAKELLGLFRRWYELDDVLQAQGLVMA